MINNSKLKQYWETYEYILNHDNCSKKQITEHLKKRTGSAISDSTFERIKSGLRELGIKIISKKGRDHWEYSVEISESSAVKEFKLVKQAANLISVPSISPFKMKEMGKYIHLTESTFVGTENLEMLIQCCMDSKEIEFSHYHIQRDESTIRKVQPYQVREYEGRWYLIGFEPKHEEARLKSFGIDRISNVKATGTIFKREPKYDPNAIYQNVIGIFPKKDAVEKIHLRTDTETWGYIKVLKWHPSQEFLGEENGKVEFEIEVKPSRELEMKILQWSSRIEVISPYSFRKEIKSQLEKGLAMNI